MGALIIIKIGYQGDFYEFESPNLDERIAIIEGPNGSGKSTFFNLIYYGLGGRVEEFERNSHTRHAEITGDKNNFVWLKIRIQSTEYSLVRKIGENLITVKALNATGVEQIADTFPIHRRDASAVFSDWILEKLGIPVVEIFQGSRSFKLNISDLMRLIYHNQAPDPHGIYKPADASNFLSDSLEVRRAIFQVLVGKTLLALYKAIGDYKKSEREFDAAKAILLEYQKIVGEVLKENVGVGVKNSHFLNTRLAEIDNQIDKLLRARAERLNARAAPNEIVQAIDQDRRHLGELEISMRRVNEDIDSLVRDKTRLGNVVTSIQDDIERVSKVIFTHEQLKLFSSDTCPYCLNSVSRIEGHCVCGNTVDENDYQRFFYSATEYVDIYRAKRKSLQTVQATILDLELEIGKAFDTRAEFEDKIADYMDRIQRAYVLPQSEISDLYVEQLEEKIFDLRSEQNELVQALKMEQKIESLQYNHDTKREILSAASRLVKQLELSSKEELNTRILEFGDIYNDFMTKVLAGCRTARIDEDTYMPIINNGEYREASAEVPKRFLYYLSLLLMSLKNDIPFPQIILVDTPETAGIDRDNLVLMLRQIKNLDRISTNYQILLSTGIDKFPPEYESYVVIRLRDNAKLLQERRDFS